MLDRSSSHVAPCLHSMRSWWMQPPRSIHHIHFQLNDEFICGAQWYCRSRLRLSEGIPQPLDSNLQTHWERTSPLTLLPFHALLSVDKSIKQNMKVTKYKTPRSLIQYPGRVYSMPQVTVLKFLVMGARLLTWMASASNEVEHKGSTVYNTPNILAQLGEHGICDLPSMHNLPIQPVNSPDTRVHDSLALSSNTLADLGCSPGGILSMVWAICSQQ